LPALAIQLNARVCERRTMRVSGFSQKLFLIAWAALGAIATIGWLYFIAISFRFIIDLLSD
jgi:hypothetical protein